VNTSKLFNTLTLVLVVAGSIGACKKGMQTGRVALSVKDGPPTSSDHRTITKLEIDITRIQLSTDSNNENDTAGGADQDQEDVVAFDAGSGAAHTVDLLKVTTFSELITTANVPAGTYGGATVAISGARAVFLDDPNTTVTLVLEGDGQTHAEFDFKFKPPAKVAPGSSTTLAVIDFVPVVTKDALGKYWLGHDGNNDESGEANDGAEVEMKGTIATVSGNTITLGPDPVATVDVSTATIEKGGAAATKADLSKGQKVELEGRFDSATGVITAKDIRIE
jgi:hypothetical protein